MSPGALSERKSVALGTKPINLSFFTSSGVRHIFAASDRPTVLYSAKGKLLFANLNESEVHFLTSFNSEAFPDSLAIAKEGMLTIGGIDAVQKLHIHTIPLGEMPRRIAHQPATKTFAVIISSGTLHHLKRHINMLVCQAVDMALRFSCFFWPTVFGVIFASLSACVQWLMVY